MSGDDILSLFMPKEAEAKARDGFADEYVQAVKTGKPRVVYAGTLESGQAFDKAKSLDSRIKNNQVYANAHGGEARWATEEMEPEETAAHIANILNNPLALTLHNYPDVNPRRPKAMFYNYDDRPITAPVEGMREGDMLITSVFEPRKQKRDFVRRLLGSPFDLSSISSLPQTGPSTQRLGFSAVEEPSTVEDIPQEPGLEKPLIDPIDLIGGIPGLISRKVPATVPVGAVANIVRMLQEAK